MGPRKEDRLSLGSEINKVIAWLRMLTKREVGVHRVCRKSGSDACLQWLVLPAVGNTVSLVAKWDHPIPKDQGHLLQFLSKENISPNIARDP